jgi:hypothetical protein
LTDARVIEKSWADPEQFAAIFDRYFGQIHRYLARRVGSKLADDLAADVFTASPSGSAPPRPGPPWPPRWPRCPPATGMCCCWSRWPS